MEKELQFVRPILEVFCKKRLPIILATKSLLIRRDIDLLSRLAADGLIEVSITMITLDESFAKLLEPGAPSPSERLELVRELTSSGIPVSFHVSPLIPGYFSDAALRKFVYVLRETKAIGAYSCILGMRRAYKDTLIKKIGTANQALAKYLVGIYNEPKTPCAISPLACVVSGEMERFSQICRECGFEFYCEHLPYLDTNTRTGGISRFKLPTIGDIYRHFIELGKQEVQLSDLEDYLVDFPAVDEIYHSLVVDLWQAGILFQDTRFGAVGIKPCKKYILTDSVQLTVSEVMTCG
jgi:DNA repair photolyase